MLLLFLFICSFLLVPFSLKLFSIFSSFLLIFTPYFSFCAIFSLSYYLFFPFSVCASSFPLFFYLLLLIFSFSIFFFDPFLIFNLFSAFSFLNITICPVTVTPCTPSPPSSVSLPSSFLLLFLFHLLRVCNYSATLNSRG